MKELLIIKFLCNLDLQHFFLVLSLKQVTNLPFNTISFTLTRETSLKTNEAYQFSPALFLNGSQVSGTLHPQMQTTQAVVRRPNRANPMMRMNMRTTRGMETGKNLSQTTGLTPRYSTTYRFQRMTKMLTTQKLGMNLKDTLRTEVTAVPVKIPLSANLRARPLITTLLVDHGN